MSTAPLVGRVSARRSPRAAPAGRGRLREVVLGPDGDLHVTTSGASTSTSVGARSPRPDVVCARVAAVLEAAIAGVPRYSLAAGALEGFWSSDQAFALAASLSRDGRGDRGAPDSLTTSAPSRRREGAS